MQAGRVVNYESFNYFKNTRPHGESNPCFRRERHIIDIPSVHFYNSLSAKPSLKTVCKSCAKYISIFTFTSCVNAWGVRKVYPNTFIGSGRNSGKQLVFKKSKRNPKRIEAVHGASLPREFERQDMAKIFNKKIKTRFPILFKRAQDFHLMKAKGRV